VVRRHELTDQAWAEIAPLLPPTGRLDPCLDGERACRFLVGGGEFRVLGPGRARLQ
jgi:transposase